MVSFPSEKIFHPKGRNIDLCFFLKIKERKKKKKYPFLCSRGEGNTVSLHFGKQARRSIPSNKWYNGSNGSAFRYIHSRISFLIRVCAAHNMVEYRRKPMKVSMTNFMLRRLPVLANFTVHRNCRSHRKVRLLYLIEN